MFESFMTSQNSDKPNNLKMITQIWNDGAKEMNEFDQVTQTEFCQESYAFLGTIPAIKGMIFIYINYGVTILEVYEELYGRPCF